MKCRFDFLKMTHEPVRNLWFKLTRNVERDRYLFRVSGLPGSSSSLSLTSSMDCKSSISWRAQSATRWWGNREEWPLSFTAARFPEGQKSYQPPRFIYVPSFNLPHRPLNDCYLWSVSASCYCCWTLCDVTHLRPLFVADALCAVILNQMDWFFFGICLVNDMNCDLVGQYGDGREKYTRQEQNSSGLWFGRGRSLLVAEGGWL